MDTCGTFMGQKTCSDEQEAKINTARAFSILAMLVAIPAIGTTFLGTAEGKAGAGLSIVCALFCLIAFAVPVCPNKEAAAKRTCAVGPFEDGTKAGAGFIMLIMAMLIYLAGAALAFMAGRQASASASAAGGGATAEVKNPAGSAAAKNDEL